VLRFFGPSESAVARALEESGGEVEGLEITVCARDLEIHVDVFYDESAAERVATLQGRLAEAFPRELFAVDDDRPVEALVLESLREHGFRLATAESCTGGLVGARLTEVPGSSKVYVGGVIAYSDDVKRAEINVPAETLAAYGAVSAETAAAMARGARGRFGTEVAVAVTGIAGPDGGTAEKPVGLVYLHAEAPGDGAALRVVLPGDREAVRARATALALHMVRRLLVQPATHRRESND
jgi:nicotinamide-nucleotide amidase